jgi:hypothetical protein
MIGTERLLHASAELRDHFAGKDRAEQFAAEFLCRLQFRCVGSPHAPAHLSDAAEEVPELNVRERKREFTGCLSGRRIQQAHSILFASAFDLQIEIIVRQGHGYFPLAALLFQVGLMSNLVWSEDFAIVAPVFNPNSLSTSSGRLASERN